MKCVDCNLNEADVKWGKHCEMCEMIETWYQYEVWDGGEFNLHEFRQKLTLADIAKMRREWWQR